MKTGNQVISVDLLPNRKVEISPMKKFMPVNHDEERNDSSVTIDAIVLARSNPSKQLNDSIAIFESQSEVKIVSLSLSKMATW